MRDWILKAMAVTLLMPSMAMARQGGVMVFGDGDASQPAVWAIGGDDEESLAVLGGHKAYLGVDVYDVTADRMAALKLKEERGVEVRLVDQDAPAGKAGLKVGDVILEFNGQRVESSEALRRMIHETPPGRTVKLGISRDGQPMTLTAQLGDRGKMYAEKYKVIMPKMPKMQEMPAVDVVVRTSVARNGLVVENLTNQLGEFFGVKDGAGVLVRSVEKGSPAESAGFKAGDVITSVGSDKVTDTGDWRTAMRRQKGGALSVGIIREKRAQTLTLNLPERKSDDSSMLHFDWQGIEIPEMDFDFDMDDFQPDMDQLRMELDKIRPEVERAASQARAQAAQARVQAVQAVRVSQAEAQRSMQDMKRQIRQQIEEQRQEIERQKQEQKRQLNEIQ